MSINLLTERPSWVNLRFDPAVKSPRAARCAVDNLHKIMPPRKPFAAAGIELRNVRVIRTTTTPGYHAELRWLGNCVGEVQCAGNGADVEVKYHTMTSDVKDMQQRVDSLPAVSSYDTAYKAVTWVLPGAKRIIEEVLESPPFPVLLRVEDIVEELMLPYLERDRVRNMDLRFVTFPRDEAPRHYLAQSSAAVGNNVTLAEIRRPTNYAWFYPCPHGLGTHREGGRPFVDIRRKSRTALIQHATVSLRESSDARLRICAGGKSRWLDLGEFRKYWETL